MKNVLLGLMALGLVFVTACSQQTDAEPDPIEVEDLQNAAEDAGDAIGDTIEDSVDVLQDGVDEVEDEM